MDKTFLCMLAGMVIGTVAAYVGYIAWSARVRMKGVS